MKTNIQKQSMWRRPWHVTKAGKRAIDAQKAYEWRAKYEQQIAYRVTWDAPGGFVFTDVQAIWVGFITILIMVSGGAIVLNWAGIL